MRRGDTNPLKQIPIQKLIANATPFIQANPLFKEISLHAGSTMLNYCNLLHPKRYQIIYKQNEQADERGYIVLGGSIELKGFAGKSEEF